MRDRANLQAVPSALHMLPGFCSAPRVEAQPCPITASECPARLSDQTGLPGLLPPPRLCSPSSEACWARARRRGRKWEQDPSLPDGTAGFAAADSVPPTLNFGLWCQQRGASPNDFGRVLAGLGAWYSAISSPLSRADAPLSGVRG